MGFEGQMLYWIAIGILLLLLEITTGTFILLGFGVAALILAGVTFLLVVSLPIQIVIFAFLGVINLFIFKKKFRGVQKNIAFEADRESKFKSDKDILPNEETSISYQGSLWTAINIGNDKIHKGDSVIVKSTDGIKILIQKDRG